MNAQAHIEQMRQAVSHTYGIPTEQVIAWEELPNETKMQIVKTSGLGEAILSYSWVAMPLEAQQALLMAGQRLLKRGQERLNQISGFVEAF